jgi:type IV pilus assembly protein PilP
VGFSAIATAIALLLLAGCESEKNQPTAADFEQERSKLMARVEARKASKQSAPPKAASEAAKPAVVAATSDPMESSFGGGGGGFEYNRIGKTDPFRSFEWERLEMTDPRGGPLEQFDVSQLSVIAVVWKTGSARALVEDPGGESYIIAKGTRIGKNDGTVTKIDDNLVVVNESYEDYLGNVTQKDVELRIRRSEGG